MPAKAEDRKPAADSLTAVVAMTSRGVIGRDGGIPWHLSSDLRRFKRLTMGGVLIMGRRTYESIGRPLPGRRTVVITGNADWSAEGTERAETPQLAVELASQLGGRVFVVGGGEIYRHLLPQCDRLYLTKVWSNVDGDTKLSIDLSEFQVIEHTHLAAGPRDDVPSDFARMIRRNY